MTATIDAKFTSLSLGEKFGAFCVKYLKPLRRVPPCASPRCSVRRGQRRESGGPRGGAAGGTTAPKVSGGCRRAGSRGAARHMLPTPATLAPLDPHKTRALTTIYAPRKLKPRKHKTAQTRMLEELTIKPTLTPFHPLPAIGQKIDKNAETKVFILDLKDDRPSTMERVKLHDVLKPLTPLRIHTYRKSSLQPLDKDSPEDKPQQLVRENTYDVIEPIYLSATKVQKRDRSISRRTASDKSESGEENKEESKISPKLRFKKAAMQVAKLTSMPETGKLLCLREKQTFNVCKHEDDKFCRLQELPHSPPQNITKLSEIFQSLDTKGRHRDKMKKENSWF